MPRYRHLMVPYDFSVHSRAALEIALDLGVRLRAALHLVHVVRRGERTAEAGRALAAVVDSISGLGCEVDAYVVESEDVADRLTKSAAGLDADLIVMGAHGRTEDPRLLGAVAERLLQWAPCAVLTVRAEEDGEERSLGSIRGRAWARRLD